MGFFIGPRARTHAEGRLSGSIKRIRLRVSVKSATKCTIKRVLRALPTLPRTLKRTLNRGTYSDTLNRSAYSIRLTQRHSSIENPTLNPEAPFRKTYDNGKWEEYSLTSLTNGTIRMVEAPDKLKILCAYIWRKRSSNNGTEPIR